MFATRAVLPVVALVLSVAACGGTTGGATGGPASPACLAASSSATRGGAFANSALQNCLRQHGVNVTPRPRPSGSPRSRPSGGPGAGFSGGLPTSGPLAAAFQACRQYVRTPAIGTTALTAFKSCMSQHGVTITGSTFRQITSQAHASSKARTAFTTCGVLLRTGTSPRPSPSN